MWLVTKYIKRKERKNPPVLNYDYHPFVSILIPCHNEEDVIEKTALNVLNLNYKDFEIILIDDRSTDKTPEIVKKLADEYDKITCLLRTKEATPGKSEVLKDAMKLIKGEAVLVFDADAKIEPDFLDKMIPILEPVDVGAIQAQKVIINANQNFLTKCQYN